MLKDESLLAWWRLLRLPGVGLVSANAIRQRLNNPCDLARLTLADLVAYGLRPDAAQRWLTDSSLTAGFEAVVQWRQQPQCGVLLAGLAPYPDALSSLRDAPILLFYQGDLSVLQGPCVAMVGSRNPTPYAREWAQQTAKQLAAADVTVVSGLAVGIDGAVHQGAIDGGKTIAVLGSGLDVIYPAKHLGLAHMIVQHGLLLSEFPPGTAAHASHFPARNRIISGLSRATVVVEAAIKSGTLITARLAAEQGRDVMALPGAVTNPLSRGCHQLIRDGALLVESADDILRECLSLPMQSQADLFAHGSTSAVPVLVSVIDYSLTPIDVIGLRSQLSMAQLLPELLELELQGWLQQVPGGYVRLR